MMKLETIPSGSDVVREELLAPEKPQSQTDHPILWGFSHRCGDRWVRQLLKQAYSYVRAFVWKRRFLYPRGQRGFEGEASTSPIPDLCVNLTLGIEFLARFFHVTALAFRASSRSSS